MTATLTRHSAPRDTELFDDFYGVLDQFDEPLGFEAGDANLYRYVGNQATTLVDPDGTRPTPVRPIQRPLPVGTPGTGGRPGSGPSPGPGPGITPGDWTLPSCPSFEYLRQREARKPRIPRQILNDIRSLDPDPLLPGQTKPEPWKWFADEAVRRAGVKEEYDCKLIGTGGNDGRGKATCTYDCTGPNGEKKQYTIEKPWPWGTPNPCAWEAKFWL